MKRKFREWLSIQTVKNPGRIVLCAILLFNIVFFFISASVISSFSLSGTEQMSFLEAAFCTITMVLDAGCISYVVEDIGQAGFTVTIVCLLIVLIGMISFTGAVIGYITNYISDFIANANKGRRVLHISDHFVILGWNTRASEIVNDMIYSGNRDKIVILTPADSEKIKKEIFERISDTVEKENTALKKRCKKLNFIDRIKTYNKDRLKKRLTVIVRNGDIYSSKQLNDISLKRARAVMILSNDEKPYEPGGGNSQTIKTLMQVADITGDESSADNQKIIVEITDAWTWDIVGKITEAKKVEGKCNIIPVKINEIHGQILSQFCLMPELNNVYSELFSNRGSEFYSVPDVCEDENVFIKEYMKDHKHAVPVTCSNINGHIYGFFVASEKKDIDKKSDVENTSYSVSINKNYKAEHKTILILGHNSTSSDIMAGFAAYCSEWQANNENLINVIVIDSKSNLERMNYYKGYPFELHTVEADIYDKDIICSTMEETVNKTSGNISILILSDDTADEENIDADALASLVYVHNIIDRAKKNNKQNIDVVVEIINPKHHDIVNSYSINNVVISNRYISKMITQISEVESIFELYHDILTYDTDISCGYDSKEIYVKKVSRYFNELPGKTDAYNLIKAVHEESMKIGNPAIALGYVKPGNDPVFFCNDLNRIKVELTPEDKLILFSAH